MKNILKEAKSIKRLSDVYDRYWPVMTALTTIIPKSKIEDLKNIQNILSEAKSQNKPTVYAGE